MALMMFAISVPVGGAGVYEPVLTIVIGAALSPPILVELVAGWFG